MYATYSLIGNVGVTYIDINKTLVHKCWQQIVIITLLSISEHYANIYELVLIEYIYNVDIHVCSVFVNYYNTYLIISPLCFALLSLITRFYGCSHVQQVEL